MLVAVSDPTNVVVSDDLRLAVGASIRIGVASAQSIANAISKVYGGAVLDEDAEQADERVLEHDVSGTVVDLREASSLAPAIKQVNAVLSRAIDLGASDVHFTPQQNRLLVRARRRRHARAGVDREEPLAGRDESPQGAGRAGHRREARTAGRTARDPNPRERTIDLRVAVLPTTFGEKVTLRIMSSGEDGTSLEQLGMSEGALIVVGPTGSGKSTTLDAALAHVNDDERVTMTIEDPVEYQVPNADQIEVNPRAGLTFATGLRTILRCDPDVILVGEIRDEETAEIAFQAAMTGHMVLSSLHGQNAASAVARLNDTGVEPQMMATSLNCIVAQRLVRKLCQHCREPHSPDASELADIGLSSVETGQTWIYRATGCEACSFTGYAGRVGLFEVMPIRGEIRSLVERSTEEIFAAAVEHGMTTMRQDGIRNVLAGLTSLGEVRRVTGDRTT